MREPPPSEESFLERCPPILGSNHIPVYFILLFIDSQHTGYKPSWMPGFSHDCFTAERNIYSAPGNGSCSSHM